MVDPIQRTPEVQHVNGTQNARDSKEKPDNTVDVKQKTSAYLLTESKIQKAKENLENLKVTNPQRYAELKKVYENSTYQILDDGTVSFNVNGTIKPKDFIVAYGIEDGALIDHLDLRHKKDMARGIADVVPQGKATAEQTLLAYNAADPGAQIEFTDGMKYTKARGWLSGDLFDKRDCTKMVLETGDSFKIQPDKINNKRSIDKM